ncbi:unnamed protein product [Acanthosepion pharaonis]|uniref:Uncharacterized protein n=1 Tax=Acanthosepion pharaonis TaxID=158019 RepID=A0A812C6K1_ACAPH|nr:unnamed protein product [Sepia pharaonis]
MKINLCDCRRTSTTLLGLWGRRSSVQGLPGKNPELQSQPKNKNYDETQTTEQTLTKGVKEVGEWTEVVKKGSKVATTPHQQQQKQHQKGYNKTKLKQEDHQIQEQEERPGGYIHQKTRNSCPKQPLFFLFESTAVPPSQHILNITAGNDNSTPPRPPLPNSPTPSNTSTPSTSQHSPSHKYTWVGEESCQVVRQAPERDIIPE